MEWFSIADTILSVVMVLFLALIMRAVGKSYQMLRWLRNDVSSLSLSKELCPKCHKPVKEHTIEEARKCGILKGLTEPTTKEGKLKKEIFK